MSIESALKTIGDWISKETESRKYPKSELLELSESLQALKAEIARQSVKSEEVESAIERFQKRSNNARAIQDNGDFGCVDMETWEKYQGIIEDCDLAITALQACQTKEPCDYCKSGIDTVSLMDSDMVMRFVSQVNYCPNCGQAIDWSERSMNLENFNSELRKRLDNLETEKRNKGKAIIDQLINDIRENDWYCIQNGSECNLHEWEKVLLVAGLESLLGEGITSEKSKN